jgi:hypothetical protein
MKKLNLLLFIFLLSSIICFSQEEKSKVAFARDKTELLKNKSDGKFLFVLPQNTSAEDVKRNSSFYISYFTVKFDTNSKETIIQMKTNDENSRHIISRFLTSFDIEYIQSEGKLYRIEEFYENFLK